MRAFGIVMIFLISSFVGWSQAPVPRLQHYGPGEYGAYQTPENWCITEDSDGVMYFGNAGAVLSFDGERWDTTSIRQGLFVMSLASDNQNRIYVGTEGEFGEILRHPNGKRYYKSLAESSEELPFSTVWRVHAIGEKVFFQSAEAIFIYDPSNGELETIRPFSSFHLSFVSEGELYVRERGDGLKRYNPENGLLELVKQGELFELYGLFDIIKHPTLKDAQILVTAEIGLFWMYEEGITPMLSKDSSFLNTAGIIGGEVINNRLYLHSLTSGVIVTDLNGNIERIIDKKAGLRSDEIKSSFLDSKGNLWLATANGIDVLNTAVPLSIYDSKTGLDGSVNAWSEYQGQLYVATSSGLFAQHPAGHFMSTEIVGQTWDLLVANDMMMVGTAEGLFVMRDGRFQQVHDFTCEQLFYDTEQGFLIVANDQTIIILDAINRFSIVTAYGVSMVHALDIVQSPKDQSIWIGSSQGGAQRLKFNGIDYDHTVYGYEDGLHQGEWIKPFVYNGEVLFGTPTELLKLVDESEISEDGSIKGYFDNNKEVLKEQADLHNGISGWGDRTWVSVSNQVWALKSDKSLAPYPFQNIHLGRINFIEAASNGLWIGGADGLAVYDFNIAKGEGNTAHTLQLVWHSVSFGDSIWSYQSTTDNLVVPYKSNDLIIELGLHSQSVTGDHWYRYKLDDKEWSNWSENATLSISHIPSGDHQLTIEGKDQLDGISQPFTFEFHIEKPWYATWWAITLYAIVLGFIIWLAILAGRYRLKKQNARLEETVRERTAEIAEKNQELELKHDEIKLQKEEITDSINYARRIQEAILPLDEDISKSLKDYFVLYQPKDIVSGDFYWFSEVNGKKIFVCADCTGHGVPGAFMSMIGSDKLNRKVLEEGFTSPDDILRELNVGIKQSLKQSEEEGSTRDGMDAAIICLEGNKLTYAGANRPLWLIRDRELLETKATKTAVAGFTPDEQIYELHTIELLPGDRIYMTTDGYPDQFGGEKGKKFKLKNMKSLILHHHLKPMMEQHDIYHKTIEDWKGEFEQIDDICVVGIQFDG